MTGVRIGTFAARSVPGGVQVWRAGSKFRGEGRTLSEALDHLDTQESAAASPTLSPDAADLPAGLDAPSISPAGNRETAI